jgi:hypothetical protein
LLATLRIWLDIDWRPHAVQAECYGYGLPLAPGIAARRLLLRRVGPVGSRWHTYDVRGRPGRPSPVTRT